MKRLFENHASKMSYELENANDLNWFRNNPNQRERKRPVLEWESREYGSNLVGVVVTNHNQQGLEKKFFGADHPEAKKLTSRK